LIHKTRGIVFRFTRYGETSIIVTIFTELFGLQSYIVNGVRSKSGKNKIALYQPLTLLNLVVYYRENANIERIKEIQCYHPYSSVATDIRKSTMGLFITEVLNKTVKDESHTAELYSFISKSLITLDQMEHAFENFHLLFLLKLCRFLGFGIQNTNEILGPRITDDSSEKIIARLLHAEYEEVIMITSKQRREILELILEFYTDHLEGLGEIKSVQVLKEVLN
jgi:DNA repair protein RecO (recombination protein O)